MRGRDSQLVYTEYHQMVGLPGAVAWGSGAGLCVGVGTRAASIRTVTAENPRSNVMPRCLLCGCLSSAAVDSVVDSAATVQITGQGCCEIERTARRTQASFPAIHMAKHTHIEVADASRLGHPAGECVVNRFFLEFACHNHPSLPLITTASARSAAQVA